MNQQGRYEENSGAGRAVPVRWAIPLLAASLVVVSACASDPTRSEEYQTLQASLEMTERELDRVEARLAGSQVALTESQARLDAAEAELTERERQVAALEGAVEGMLFGIEEIRTYVEAHASGDLWLNEESRQAAVANGVSVEAADRLVVELDLPGSDWEGYTSDDNWWCWCQLVGDLDDPVASAALDAWLETEYGSEEEWWAFYDVQLILLDLLVEAIAEVEGHGVAAIEGGDG